MTLSRRLRLSLLVVILTPPLLPHSAACPYRGPNHSGARYGRRSCGPRTVNHCSPRSRPTPQIYSWHVAAWRRDCSPGDGDYSNAPASQGRSKQVVDYSRRRFRYRASSNWSKSTNGGSAGIGLNRRCPEAGRFVLRQSRGVEVAPFRSQPVVATLGCPRPTAIAAVRDSNPALSPNWDGSNAAISLHHAINNQPLFVADIGYTHVNFPY